MISKYHKYVRDLLLTDPLFRNHKIIQEYPVSSVNPDWYSNRHRFDLVILDLKVVIEVHGEQHYHRTIWEKTQSAEEVEAIFLQQKDLDYRKKQAALDAGWGYIEIPYWEINKDNITAESLMFNITRELLKTKITTTRKSDIVKADPRKTRVLERQRAQRRLEYQRMKQLKKTVEKKRQSHIEMDDND